MRVRQPRVVETQPQRTEEVADARRASAGAANVLVVHWGQVTERFIWHDEELTEYEYERAGPVSSTGVPK